MSTCNKVKPDKELQVLIRSAKISSHKALRSSRAMGLTIKFISNNTIIEELPNGERKIIRKIATVPTNQKGLKKGTVLCKK